MGVLKQQEQITITDSRFWSDTVLPQYPLDPEDLNNAERFCGRRSDFLSKVTPIIEQRVNVYASNVNLNLLVMKDLKEQLTQANSPETVEAIKNKIRRIFYTSEAGRGTTRRANDIVLMNPDVEKIFEQVSLGAIGADALVYLCWEGKYCFTARMELGERASNVDISREMLKHTLGFTINKTKAFEQQEYELIGNVKPVFRDEGAIRYPYFVHILDVLWSAMEQRSLTYSEFITILWHDLVEKGVEFSFDAKKNTTCS